MDKDLSGMTLAQLKQEAAKLGIPKVYSYNKAELIEKINQQGEATEETSKGEAKEVQISQAEEKAVSAQRSLSSKRNDTDKSDGSRPERDKRYAKLKDPISESFDMTGSVVVLPEGFGFLKTPEMSSSDEYVYVSASQVQKFKLVSGDTINGKVRPPKEGEKYYAMLFVEGVNGKLTRDIIQQERQVMNAGNEKDMSVYERPQSGILELFPDGYGFLRKENYMSGPNDIYVSPPQIRKYRLRSGDEVSGKIRLSGENDRYDALLYVESVNGIPAEKSTNRADFDFLVPIFPDKKITLETCSKTLSTRILDLFAPIGFGQRGLIVSAPKAGKTILLKEIATAIRKNHPQAKLIILLVGERPEEVTDMIRSIDADVVYSTFDQKPEHRVKVAEMVIERAKRLVEVKKDVIILVDSITRLARANNDVVPSSGRTLTGGLDPDSLYFPKKFFGAARNVEGGGSLTILATALIETGSRMDDVIFEEFKGTGNMEVHLERELAESRVYPAINVLRSGTRREEKLLADDELDASFIVRRALFPSGMRACTETLIGYLKKTKTNKDFINIVKKNLKKNDFD